MHKIQVSVKENWYKILVMFSHIWNKIQVQTISTEIGGRLNFRVPVCKFKFQRVIFRRINFQMRA